MKYLAPSILAADFVRLEEQVIEVERSGVHYLHFDVMDGCFVPNISFGLPLLGKLRHVSGLVMDVHLMIENPLRYVGQAADLGADIITVHEEACADLKEAVRVIRSTGKRVGLAIDPETPVSRLEPVLPELDLALIMTVKAGFGGQKLIPKTLDKVRTLRKRLDAEGLKADLEVDGGINMETIDLALDAGANVFVAGSAIFKGDISGNVKRFLEKLEQE